jgi:flagella basal body P-ring formation protein FlgA
LSKFLEANLKDYERIEYTIISPSDIQSDYYKLDNSRELKVNGPFAYVPIKQYLTNGNTKNSVLTLKLRIFKKVLVANRNLSRRENLRSEDFRIIEQEISTLRYSPINSSLPLSSYRASTKIDENSIVQKNMIEKIPEIEIGDRVEAIFSKSSVNVSFKVTARSSGGNGSIIKVKRDDKKIFKARVINNSTVQIIE